MRQEGNMLFCHIPGYCQRSFDDWAEYETFLGFSIPNPLEDCSWLEKATYVAMPIGFRDAPHVKVSWYGTKRAMWSGSAFKLVTGTIRFVLW